VSHPGDHRGIALRGLSLSALKYQTTGKLQSKPIDFPELGIVVFQTIQSTASQLTAITHQISFDGMQYVAIHPGQQIDLGGKRFWFRSLMERLDGNFDQISQPIESPGQDPGLSDYYKVNNVASFDLGNGMLERTISLDLLVKDPPDGLDRIVELREDPLPGTVTVYQDTALLGPQEYTFNGHNVSFSGNDERPNVTIRYQSAFGGVGVVVKFLYLVGAFSGSSRVVKSYRPNR
jgi:hypothetical protein